MAITGIYGRMMLVRSEDPLPDALFKLLNKVWADLKVGDKTKGLPYGSPLIWGPSSILTKIYAKGFRVHEKRIFLTLS